MNSRSLPNRIRKCSLCADKIPLSPKPIFQFSKASKILLIGQAPGIKAHESGVPWNDKSGERLRDWLDVSDQLFYDPKVFAIVPMAFCYPGRGKGGDLPPPKACSEKWMQPIGEYLSEIELKIYVGKHACEYGFGKIKNLTNFLKNGEALSKNEIALPHPSPRNNIWLAKNGWFENDLLPQIKKKLSNFL